MTLREDTIVRADGSTGLYSVVEKPDFAVIAAVSNGELYLVEQYRYPVQARFWELPQGSWEQQTVDPQVLAKAELREETGLIAGSMLHAHCGRFLFEAAKVYIKEVHPEPCRMELHVNRHNKALDFYKRMGMKLVRQGDFAIGNGYFMNDYIMSIDV